MSGLNVGLMTLVAIGTAICLAVLNGTDPVSPMALIYGGAIAGFGIGAQAVIINRSDENDL